MKIIGIEIENFKSIKKLNLKNIPNLVVIAGPNGVGKTSILEAIRFVKSRLYPYHYQELQQSQNPEYMNNLIRNGEKKAKILLEIAPTTEQEKKIIGEDKKATIGLEYDNGSWNNIATIHCGEIFRPPQEGSENTIIEYVSAYRTYPEGKAQLEVGQQNSDFFLSSRLGLNPQKFVKLKQTILSIYADDHLIESSDKRFPEIVELIKKLIGREIIVKFKRGAVGEIFVKNEDGTLDLDSLSSGEREILMTYFTLHTLKMSHSVILFDEPELHLHPSSQKAAFNYIQDMAKTGNQVFITTHSSEIISLTPDESLFHLRKHDDNQLVNIKDENDKLLLYEKLGSSKFNFIAYDKTVFVEGSTDKNILSKIHVNDYNMKFEVFNGGAHMTPEILEIISNLGRVAMIKDRDFYSDEEIENMIKKAPKKLFFWSRREIENFILDSPVLFEIYSTIGKNEIKSYNDFIQSIKNISNNYIQQTVLDKFLFEQNSKLNPPKPRLQNGVKAIDEIKNYYNIRTQRTEKLINELDTKIPLLESELKQNWDKCWLSHVDPKILLSHIGTEFFKNSISKDVLMDMVLLKLDANDKFPQELVTVMNAIAQN
jgi:predicted ATPase